MERLTRIGEPHVKTRNLVNRRLEKILVGLYNHLSIMRAANRKRIVQLSVKNIRIDT